MSWRRKLARVPALGSVFVLAYRARGAYKSQFRARHRNFIRWLVASREIGNYTYDLTATNKRYLISFVAHLTATPRTEIEAYLAELDNDHALRAHILRATRESPARRFADERVDYGRRLGWYVLGRALKPRLVIETGVDKGLGSCVLAAMILRNRDEGYEGRYIGTEIDPTAGYLFSGRYAEAGQIIYNDSIKTLESLCDEIDFFVNDSDHSATYEAREYQVIESKLSNRALIIGDNAHESAGSDALCRFAEATGRDFVFFQESPKDHFYAGAGIGAAFFAGSLAPSLEVPGSRMDNIDSSKSSFPVR